MYFCPSSIHIGSVALAKDNVQIIKADYLID